MIFHLCEKPKWKEICHFPLSAFSSNDLIVYGRAGVLS